MSEYDTAPSKPDFERRPIDAGSRPVTAPTPAPEPVTNADEFDPAVVELVAEALARVFGWPGLAGVSAALPDVGESFRSDAASIVAVLVEADRLLPPDTDTRPDLWQYAYPDLDEPDGYLPLEGTPRIVTPRMVRRPMRAVGPWRPVPSTQETP